MMLSEVRPRMVWKTLVPNRERARIQRVEVNKGIPPVICLMSLSNAFAPSGVSGRAGALAAMISCWMRMGPNKPKRMERNQRKAEIKLKRNEQSIANQTGR